MSTYTEDAEAETCGYDERFLAFKAGSFHCCVPLLSVREIVEFQETKPIPGAASYFKGVINIRGEIVGVIDLGECFNIPQSIKAANVLMIFSTPEGVLAALVDQVEAVIEIRGDLIESKATLDCPIPDEYLKGVACLNDRMIFVVQLDQLLANQKLASN